MNIILIGFMGSGKSVVGQLLARKMKMDYLDADELIEKTEKMSISDIFAKKGEPYFRQLESQVIKTLQDYDNFVISTGGGMVLRPENVKMLKGVGPLALLWAEPDVIYQRIKNQRHRPLLKVKDPRGEIYKILKKREPIYRQAADLEVDTCKLSVEEVSSKIITWLKSK